MIKDSGERREFGENGAVRDMSEGKGDMASVPWEAVLRLSRHYEEGAKKYKRWNFRAGKGIPISSYLDSAMRHLAKYMCGCDDEDHLSAAAFNVLGAMLVEETHPDMIDIPMREGKNRFCYFEEEKKQREFPDFMLPPTIKSADDRRECSNCKDFITSEEYSGEFGWCKKYPCKQPNAISFTVCDQYEAIEV